MKNTVGVLVVLMFALTLVGCSTGGHTGYIPEPVYVQADHRRPRMGAKPSEYEPNSLIIGYEPTQREAVLAKIANLGGVVSREYTLFSGVAVRFADIEKARQELKNTKGVSAIDYNAVIRVDDGVVTPPTQ